MDYQSFGFVDTASRTPLCDDAIFRMYSNTKIVTSVFLMMLYEEGLFDLDDPLAKFLPKNRPASVDCKCHDRNRYKACRASDQHTSAAKHNAGLSYGFVEPDSLVKKAYNSGAIDALSDASIDPAEFCQRIAKPPLAFEPGSSWRYSVATDVCARLVEVLAGQALDDFLRQRIFVPLGMVDIDFWVPEDEANRFVTMYAPEDMSAPMQGGLIKIDDLFTGSYSKPPVLEAGGSGLL